MIPQLVIFGIVFLPLLVALALGISGAAQVRAGLRNRSFLRLAWGGSLALASAGFLVGALLRYEDTKHSGLATLWIFALWYGPLVLIPLGTLVLGSLATLVGGRRRDALAARGFVQLPTSVFTRASIAPLSVACIATILTFVQLVAIPAWKIWPYSTFMASDDMGTKTFIGHSPSRTTRIPKRSA